MAASREGPVAAPSHQADVVIGITIAREQISQNLGRQSSVIEQRVWAAASLQAPHLHTLLPLDDGPDGPTAYQNALSLR